MSTYTVDGITWNYTLDANNNATIGTGSNSHHGNATTSGTGLSGAIAIPSTLGGYTVTGIGIIAFSGCTGLTSVTIPDSVTSIGSMAFWECNGLTSVTLGNSVTTIGVNAFFLCYGLTSITIPNSVTSIEVNAFNQCNGLTSVTLGNSVTTIGVNAFRDCANLTSVTIPASVTTIDIQAFYDCSGLTSVIIEDGSLLSAISSSCFYGCSALMSINIPDSVTTIDAYSFTGCSALTSITIPDSVITIGYQAFKGCSGLTSVTLGNSVEAIHIYAFWECNGLRSINIPDSVTTIGNLAFMSTHADLFVTMNTKTIDGTTYTSPTTTDISFFGNPSVTLVLPPLTMTIISTTTGVTSGSTTNNPSIALTFTSSEATIDFVVGDITVTNGALSAFAGSGTVYTATFTPTGQGACTIDISAGVYTDGGANNIAATTFTWTFDLAAGGLSIAELLLESVIPDWNYDTNANHFDQSYLKGFTDVSGSVVIRNDNRLITNGELSLGGNLITSGTTSLVIDDMTLKSRLFMGEDITANGNVNIGGDLSINGQFSGDFANGIIPQSAIGGGGINISGNVYFADDVSFNGPTVDGTNTLQVNQIEFKDGTTVSTHDDNILSGTFAGSNVVFKDSTFAAITCEGVATAATVTQSSDYRIKEDVTELNETDTVDALVPIQYNNTLSGNHEFGLLAHELQEIYPDLVNGEKDGDEYQQVHYNGLIGVLVKDIQDIKQRLAVLNNR